MIQPYFMGNVEEFCAPVSFIATDLSDIISGTTCTIDFGDGTPPADFEVSAEHIYPASGNYQITVTCENDGVIGQYSIPLIVNAVINPVLLYNEGAGQVECSNCDLFETVEWLIDGNLNSGIGPFPDGNHLYQVTGISDSNCSGTSLIVLISTDEEIKDDIVIYPVPADESVTIVGTNIKAGDLIIMDMTGRKLEADIKSTGNGVILNTSSFAAGQYTIMIRTAEGTWNKQIEIRH